MRPATIIVDEHVALEAGLNALRRYNRVMFISLEEDSIDEAAVSGFFEAEPNSDDEKKMALILTMAAANAMLHHPDIPSANRAQCAKRVSKEFLESLQASKCLYNLETGRYGAGLKAQAKYQEELKKVNIACRAATLSQIKNKLKSVPSRLLKREGIKRISGLVAAGIAHNGITAASAGTAVAGTGAVTIAGITFTPVGVVALAGVLTYVAVDIAIAVIPQKTKKRIREKCREYIEKGCNIVSRAAQRFEKTKVGSAVKKVLEEKVAPVFERGAAAVEKAYDWTKKKVKSGLTKLKSYFA